MGGSCVTALFFFTHVLAPAGVTESDRNSASERSEEGLGCEVQMEGENKNMTNE